MSNIREIRGLSEVAGDYRAILCDVWGVIHNGRRAFDAACDALVRFREGGGKVVLITNAPVPNAQVIRYFQPLGVPEEAYDACVSSGDATRAELLRHRDDRIWLIGADSSFDGDRALWQGLDLNFVETAAAVVILCMGMDDNVNDDPEDYRERIRPGVVAGLTMICANPDIQVRVGDRLVWCAGALARIYEEEGGQVIYPGKPHPVIYRLARDVITEMGVEVADPQLLTIGDGPITDIRGANNEGLDSLYVGSGLAADDSGDFAEMTRARLAEAGVSATYAMPSLCW